MFLVHRRRSAEGRQPAGAADRLRRLQHQPDAGVRSVGSSRCSIEAASTPSPTCAAAANTARRGTRPGCSSESRTCSTTSSRRPSGWSREGYTPAGRLAIEGGSNGGLLTGAVMIQRPDLFGAVVCRVPVADMLRYHRFTIGRFWISEYGIAPTNPQQFPYLLEVLAVSQRQRRRRPTRRS